MTMQKHYNWFRDYRNKTASVKHTEGSQMVYLYIDDLKPGESRQYYIDYDQVAL